MALAHLLAEDRAPGDWLWDEVLVSSRLLEYAIWNRLHARRLQASHVGVAPSTRHFGSQRTATTSALLTRLRTRAGVTALSPTQARR